MNRMPAFVYTEYPVHARWFLCLMVDTANPRDESAWRLYFDHSRQPAQFGTNSVARLPFQRFDRLVDGSLVFWTNRGDLRLPAQPTIPARKPLLGIFETFCPRPLDQFRYRETDNGLILHQAATADP